MHETSSEKQKKIREKVRMTFASVIKEHRLRYPKYWHAEDLLDAVMCQIKNVSTKSMPRNSGMVDNFEHACLMEIELYLKMSKDRRDKVYGFKDRYTGPFEQKDDII